MSRRRLLLTARGAGFVRVPSSARVGDRLVLVTREGRFEHIVVSGDPPTFIVLKDMALVGWRKF